MGGRRNVRGMSDSGDGMRQAMRAALTAAMKQRDRTAVTALRAGLAAIDNAEAVAVPGAGADGHAPLPVSDGPIAGATAGLGSNEVARRALTDADVAAIVRAQVDERRTAADEYDRIGQSDAAANLRAEAAVLAAHLDDQ